MKQKEILSLIRKERGKNFKYEDVGRVVHNGGKIRCFKFEVLD